MGGIMGHVEKILSWHEYAKNKGMKPTAYRPPIDIFIEKLGIQCPPILFWSLPAVVITNGIVFAIFWGLFMSFTSWKGQAVEHSIFASLIAGILFGIGMAVFHLRTKKKLGLTTWDNFQKK